MPFAGRIAAAGRTPLQVQDEIQQRLAEKAIEPQAIVTVTKSITNTATVSGEVVNGARVPLSVGGDRLLDLIAAAGGAKAPVYQTFVRLSRQGVTVTIPMDRLISEPGESVPASPGGRADLGSGAANLFGVRCDRPKAPRLPWYRTEDRLGRSAGQGPGTVGSARRSAGHISVPLRPRAWSSARSKAPTLPLRARRHFSGRLPPSI